MLYQVSSRSHAPVIEPAEMCVNGIKLREAESRTESLGH